MYVFRKNGSENTRGPEKRVISGEKLVFYEKCGFPFVSETAVFIYGENLYSQRSCTSFHQRTTLVVVFFTPEKLVFHIWGWICVKTRVTNNLFQAKKKRASLPFCWRLSVVWDPLRDVLGVGLEPRREGNYVSPRTQKDACFSLLLGSRYLIDQLFAVYFLCLRPFVAG